MAVADAEERVEGQRVLALVWSDIAVAFLNVHCKRATSIPV